MMNFDSHVRSHVRCCSGCHCLNASKVASESDRGMGNSAIVNNQPAEYKNNRRSIMDPDYCAVTSQCWSWARCVYASIATASAEHAEHANYERYEGFRRLESRDVVLMMIQLQRWMQSSE